MVYQEKSSQTMVLHLRVRNSKYLCQKHIYSAPYHPSTNGLAECAVQSFKQGIKRIKGESVQERLSKYLFNYRITPHSTTGIPPAELLMSHRLRSRGTYFTWIYQLKLKNNKHIRKHAMMVQNH